MSYVGVVASLWKHRNDVVPHAVREIIGSGLVSALSFCADGSRYSWGPIRVDAEVPLATVAVAGSVRDDRLAGGRV